MYYYVATCISKKYDVDQQIDCIVYSGHGGVCVWWVGGHGSLPCAQHKFLLNKQESWYCALIFIA